MGPDPGGSEEVRGALGGRALRKRLSRLIAVGAVAILAAVLLVPELREIADRAIEDPSRTPEGLDPGRAVAMGKVVYAIGARFEDESAGPVILVHDGKWRESAAPEGASYLTDMATDGKRLFVAGSADDRPAVWTADASAAPDWEREDLDAPPGDLRAIAVSPDGERVVAVGLAFTERPVPLVLVKNGGEWSESTLPGSRVKVGGVVASGDRFVAGGRADDRAQLWSSADGIAWRPMPIAAVDAYVTQLEVDSAGAVIGVGSARGSGLVFAPGPDGHVEVDLPNEDAGESAMDLVASARGWVIVGVDIDPGDVTHGITWAAGPEARDWTLNERIAADRLNGVVVVEGKVFGVGSVARAGRLTPVLVPL